VTTERAWRRAAALEAAATAYAGVGADFHDIREAGRRITILADQFEPWLDRPAPAVTAILIADTPTDRNPQENPVSLVMPDTKKVTVRASAEDVEGAVVADAFTDPAGPYLAPFTWALDNTTVGQMTVADDTLSVDVESVPGQVGTVTVTATDANGKSLPPFTIEIDPSAAVSAALVADTPVDRTDTPAPAGA
jgi:hypothetical protein